MTAKLPVTTALSSDPQKPSGQVDKLRAPERVPVKLNRNFLNFPLARDTRTKAKWARDSKTGRWMADLPGEGRHTHRIRLILPADAHQDDRRCPSALDLNVLFQLLAEAQLQGATMQIEFASFAVLLRRLGLAGRNRERRRLEKSLFYWTQLSIQWSRWYRDRKHVALTRPPPISDAVWDGNRIAITLHPDWFQLARAPGYYAWVPLPLPPQAAAQNLVLLILTRELADGNYDHARLPEIDFELMAPLTKSMDRYWLARHMGLLHKQRNGVLNRAVGQAAAWFSAHGGKLQKAPVLIDGGEISSTKVAFRFVRPSVPRPRGHRTRKRRRRRASIQSSMGRSHGPRRLRCPVIRDQNDIDEYFALVENTGGEQ